MGSLSMKTRLPSEPESNSTRTSFLLVVLVTALAVVTMFGSTPYHSCYSGGFALRWVFVKQGTFFVSIPFVLLDDVIMTSLASLADVVFVLLELLAIVVGVAFIRLGGVKLICTTVSLNLTNFLVLPKPTPYFELKSLSL